MDIVYIINSVLQSVAVGLGIGCSTVAVTQFFYAISDGSIDEGERRIMGAVYLLLRIAMGLILATSVIMAGLIYYFAGAEYFTSLAYFNPFIVGLWSIIFVLFLNAIAMTMHWIPSKFGPGIQAGSWYTLGVMFSLIPLGLTIFTYAQFYLAYAGMMVLGVGVVNALMCYLKK